MAVYPKLMTVWTLTDGVWTLDFGQRHWNFYVGRISRFCAVAKRMCSLFRPFRKVHSFPLSNTTMNDARLLSLVPLYSTYLASSLAEPDRDGSGSARLLGEYNILQSIMAMLPGSASAKAPLSLMFQVQSCQFRWRPRPRRLNLPRTLVSMVVYTRAICRSPQWPQSEPQIKGASWPFEFKFFFELGESI